MKSFSQEWEEIHSSQDWGKYPSEMVIRFIARNYYRKNRKDVKILDFGCGGGAHTWYLAREGFDVYAFDGSPSAVKKAKEYLERDHLTAHFDVMDGAEIQYEKEYFDCVLDSACVYANEKEYITKMYQDIYSVLKNGGKIFTSCFGTQTEGYDTGTRIEENTYKDIEKGVLSGRAIAHFFTQDELKAVLQKAGFVNIEVDTMLYTDNGTLVEMFFAKAEK